MHAQRLGDLRHVERQVGVGVEHEVAGRRGEAGLDRPAELAVVRVVHDPHAGVGLAELVGDLAGRVGGGVVDDDQLVVEDLARSPAAVRTPTGPC